MSRAPAASESKVKRLLSEVGADRSRSVLQAFCRGVVGKSGLSSMDGGERGRIHKALKDGGGPQSRGRWARVRGRKKTLSFEEAKSLRHFMAKIDRPIGFKPKNPGPWQFEYPLNYGEAMGRNNLADNWDWDVLVPGIVKPRRKILVEKVVGWVTDSLGNHKLIGKPYGVEVSDPLFQGQVKKYVEQRQKLDGEAKVVWARGGVVKKAAGDGVIEKMAYGLLRRPSTYLGAGALGLGAHSAVDFHRSTGLDEARKKATAKSKEMVDSEEYLKGKGVAYGRTRKQIDSALDESGRKGLGKWFGGNLIQGGTMQGNAFAMPNKKRTWVFAGKKAPKEVLDHEVGHAKDFEDMRSKGLDPHKELTDDKWKRIWFRKKYDKRVMDMERRAWEHSGHGEDSERRQAALKSYDKAFYRNRGTFNTMGSALLGYAATIARLAGR